MLEKFKEKIAACSIPVTESGCWLWTQTVDKDGYGVLAYRVAGKKATVRAHRASFMAFVGEIQRGLFVCHKCDVPGCVNPSHLFLGTALDNTRDMIRKGRDGYRKKETHCTKGHEMNEQNTLSSGRCRECNKFRSSKRYSKARNAGVRSNVGESGVVGVHYKQCVNRWVAHIDVNKERVHLGTFKALLDAYAARMSAEIRFEAERERQFEKISQVTELNNPR